MPTCHFRRSLEDALGELEARGYGFCVAVDDAGVILGMLYKERETELRDARTVEDAMRPGPSTIRANEHLEPLIERARVDDILVTDPEGRLLGLLDRYHPEISHQESSD